MQLVRIERQDTARGRESAARRVLEVVRVHALLPGIRSGAGCAAWGLFSPRGALLLAPGQGLVRCGRWTGRPRDEAASTSAAGERRRTRPQPGPRPPLPTRGERLFSPRARTIPEKWRRRSRCTARWASATARVPSAAHARRPLSGADAAMSFRTLWFEDGALHLLDQRRLPARSEIVAVRSPARRRRDPRHGRPRGAGHRCAAAYGWLARAPRRGLRDRPPGAAGIRPTAVNLRWPSKGSGAYSRAPSRRQGGSRRVLAETSPRAGPSPQRRRAGAGRQGHPTHCNAGGLATGGIWHRPGVIRARWKRQEVRRVRRRDPPVAEAPRLTAWELLQDGIPVTLLPDVAAASLLAAAGSAAWCRRRSHRAQRRHGEQGRTYPLALAAASRRSAFFVAAPTSTVDLRPGPARDPHRATRALGSHPPGRRAVAAEGWRCSTPLST